jgi:hypothetical protein
MIIDAPAAAASTRARQVSRLSFDRMTLASGLSRTTDVGLQGAGFKALAPALLDRGA